MNGFKSLIPNVINVIRDGKAIEINTKLLVVGDIVTINAGEKIPADIRLT